MWWFGLGAPKTKADGDGGGRIEVGEEEEDEEEKDCTFKEGNEKSTWAVAGVVVLVEIVVV